MKQKELIMYLLEWHTPDGDYIYGYKTYKELMEVIETFKDKNYIHYNAYKIGQLQKLLFEN